MIDGEEKFTHLDITPNYDGAHIYLTFVQGEKDLFQFWLSPGEAVLLARLLRVAAKTETDDSFQFNHVRIKK